MRADVPDIRDLYIKTGDSFKYLGYAINPDYRDLNVLCRFLKISPSLYGCYKLDKAFKLIPIHSHATDVFIHQCNELTDYHSQIESLLNAPFPHKNSNGIVTLKTFPMFSNPSHEMNYGFIFEKEDSTQSMLLVKCYPPSMPFRKIFIPVIFLRGKDRTPFFAFSCFPIASGQKNKSERYLPLFNIRKIKKAKTIVICGAVEDADALQKSNNNTDVTFTAFVCDPKRIEQVDFSPIKGKSVIFLISNHSGKTQSDEYKETKAIYQYLKNELKRIAIKEFGFLQRFVKYNSFPPVTSKTRYYSENELDSFNPDEEDSIVLSEEASVIPAEKKDGNEIVKNQNITARNTILRPFIRRGCTTVLIGDPGIGKSRFAIALAAQVAGSKANFLEDRLWTLCKKPFKSFPGYKVVYWVFDDVTEDDIRLQRNFFARGLTEKQDKNLFIVPARAMQKRDSGSLKNELEKYTSRGTRGEPVSLLIIDTLLSFAKNPAKIFSAFEELVRLKDEKPDLAILLIHHKSKAGNSFGGVLSTNMPRVIIEMKRDSTSVLDDLKTPITINVLKHSNEHYGIDIVPFDIQLDNNGCFSVVKESDKLKWGMELNKETIGKLVVYGYKHNEVEHFSDDDIGQLLGVSGRVVRTIYTKKADQNKAHKILETIRQRQLSRNERPKTILYHVPKELTLSVVNTIQNGEFQTKSLKSANPDGLRQGSRHLEQLSMARPDNNSVEITLAVESPDEPKSRRSQRKKTAAKKNPT